jgi:hypothetical protein
VCRPLLLHAENNRTKQTNEWLPQKQNRTRIVKIKANERITEKHKLFLQTLFVGVKIEGRGEFTALKIHGLKSPGDVLRTLHVSVLSTSAETWLICQVIDLGLYVTCTYLLLPTLSITKAYINAHQKLKVT